jgi:dTDP-4-dehydrorhamnose reductase
MKKILVTGSNGQLGKALTILAKKYPQFQIMSVDKAELDITQQFRINGLFRRESFDYCINAAAYTAVDKAETEEELAHQVNVNGAKNLAEACHLLQIPLIHISTDYVYNGNQGIPITENQEVQPMGVYATSKLLGELAAKSANQQTMVIRTSWVYAPFGHNFLKTMLKYGAERETMNVVYDQIGTPTYVFDLANALLSIIDKVEKKMVAKELLFDTYHYSNEGVASWYDFAKIIFDTQKMHCKLNPILSEAYPTPAKRPAFSLLDKTKIKTTFGIEIPNWMDSVRKCLKEI